VASDNGKEKKILSKKPMPMSKKIKKEISSQEETEDEEEEVFSEIGSEIESDEEYDSEGSGRSDSEASWIDDKVNAKSAVPKPLATKRQTVKDVVKKSPTKRKIVEKKPKEYEKPSKVAKVTKPMTTSTGKKKPELPPFTDKDVDIDLYHASPTNVVPVKIKVSNNLIVSCRNVDQAESKNITYDYAAITIQKKTGNDKMFEFIMPLSLTPRIISALKLIIRENTKFFEPETLEDIPIRN